MTPDQLENTQTRSYRVRNGATIREMKMSCDQNFIVGMDFYKKRSEPYLPPSFFFTLVVS